MARLFETESQVLREGFGVVAGLDEAGRGCLAGSVYAAAVAFPPGVRLRGLDDSKVLPAEVREGLAGQIRSRALGAGVGAATAAEIDALGIVCATHLAMRRALDNLGARGVVPDFLLLDAVRLPGLAVEQRPVVHGDARLACVAAASIVAKAERDHAMDRLHRLWPVYGFDLHRGYATPGHLQALRRHGPSPEHRLTFDRVLVRRPPRAA